MYKIFLFCCNNLLGFSAHSNHTQTTLKPPVPLKNEMFSSLSDYEYLYYPGCQSVCRCLPVCLSVCLSAVSQVSQSVSLAIFLSFCLSVSLLVDKSVSQIIAIWGTSAFNQRFLSLLSIKKYQSWTLVNTRELSRALRKMSRQHCAIGTRYVT